MQVHHLGPVRCRSHVVTAFVALATLMLTVLFGTAPASARSNPAAKHVPTCTALPRMSNTPVAWVDNHSERSPLLRNMAKLICSAADHSTIDIKSWFIEADDPTVTALVADLRLMHRYHHVQVNVLVGREVYTTHQWSWHAFTHSFAFATVASCFRVCGNNAVGTVPHGKWMTVSALRQGGPAVLSMSANWNHEQFTRAQSGIFIPGDRAIYRAFTNRWNQLKPCFGGKSCTVPVHDGWLKGAHGTSVYFAPVPDDLTAGVLSTVDCSKGGSILVLSMFFHRRTIEQQLLRLQAQGCHIRVVLEHAPVTRISNEFPTRCEDQHDKAMVIDVPGRRMVIAGSEALSTHASTVNENQTIMTSTPGVVSTYGRYLGSQWSQSTTCNRS